MRHSARCMCLLGLLVGLASMASSVTFSRAAQVSDSGAQVASLKDQLEKGLRARRSVEFQFVNRVAQLVDQGRLSKEFVQGCFSWTLRKYRDRKASLVPYFEQVLRQRAAKDGNTALNNVPSTFISE